MKAQKIIWAFDPTQKPEDAKNLLVEIRRWARKLKCEVQPVCVVAETPAFFGAELTFPWMDVRSYMEGAIQRYIIKTKTKDFLPPQSVYVSSLSNRGMAKKLAEVADKTKALMIFANTRARNTWNPFRLGGFAETLIATAQTPIFLMNEKAKVSNDMKNILFPTDFGKETKSTLLHLLPWAKAMDSKITLFNHVEGLVAYSATPIGVAGTHVEAYQSLLKEIEGKRNKDAEKILQFIEKHDVAAEKVIKRQRRYLAQEVVELANKKEADLIALVSRSGTIAQALVGGVPRDVLLSATCPVLIFHNTKIMREHKTKSAKSFKSNGLGKQQAAAVLNS